MLSGNLKLAELEREKGGPGSGTAPAERHRVRPAEAALCAHLSYAQLTCGNPVVNHGNQQISSCFLQDLHSEVELPQMQRSYEGVKLAKRCEVVTVDRRAAHGGESRCEAMSLNLVQSGFNCFLLVP